MGAADDEARRPAAGNASGAGRPDGLHCCWETTGMAPQQSAGPPDGRFWTRRQRGKVTARRTLEKTDRTTRRGTVDAGEKERQRCSETGTLLPRRIHKWTPCLRYRGSRFRCRQEQAHGSRTQKDKMYGRDGETRNGSSTDQSNQALTGITLERPVRRGRKRRRMKRRGEDKAAV